MIRNISQWKRLLAVGIMLILGMTGCGTDNSINPEEVMATADSAEVSDTGDTATDASKAETTGTAEDVEARMTEEVQASPEPAQEQNTAERMAGRTKVKGIYVTGPKAGSAGMEDLIRLVDETELNAMVIDVKTTKEILHSV